MTSEESKEINKGSVDKTRGRWSADDKERLTKILMQPSEHGRDWLQMKSQHFPHRSVKAVIRAAEKIKKALKPYLPKTPSSAPRSRKANPGSTNPEEVFKP